MSLDNIVVTVEKKTINVRVKPVQTVLVETPSRPGLLVIAAGNVGPRGPAGRWEALTQSEYDALNPPDPDILYVIIQ